MGVGKVEDAVTQPTPPVACTAHRYALNEWWQGVAHLQHRCTNPTTPHPTQPHVCVCGHAWAGVGIVQCSDCMAVQPIGQLRKAEDGKGGVVYLCVDRIECARAHHLGAAVGRTGLDTLAAGDSDDHSTCDPADCDVAAYVTDVARAHAAVEAITGEPYTPPAALDVAGRAHITLGHFGPVCAACREAARIAWSVMVADGYARRSESDSAGPGVPTTTEQTPDGPTDHVAGASAIVAGLLAMVTQADPDNPPSLPALRHYLLRAQMALARAEGGRGVRPHMRVPGQIRHGEIRNGGAMR